MHNMSLSSKNTMGKGNKKLLARALRHRRHKRIFFSILGASAFLCLTFLFLHKSISSEFSSFRNNEVRYAEVSTTSLPEPSFGTTSSATSGIVPLVVYHIVRPAYPDDSEAVKGLAQTPELFDAQMKYLGEAGYHVVSFGALEEHLTHGTPLPKKPIVISFDDGWQDQFIYAFPILKKYNYTATFFVFTNSIGRRGFLTWNNLRTLRDAHMTIGSHTLSHPFLTAISDPAILWNEIVESKKKLERHLGIVVREFAYPFGYYNPEIVAMVKKAGYSSARGDRKSKEQSVEQLFTLGAQNAPTSLQLFIRAFP